jgi:hypothetical protein
MDFIHIDKKNCMEGSCNMVKELDTILGNKDKKVFLLIFMEGCGPCNATRPEWSKIKNVLSSSFFRKNNVVVAAIDHELSDKLTNLKTKPTGFPTMRFIAESGNISENYEDSNIENKDRKIDSFVEWIHSKLPEQTTNTKHSSKKTQKGGKWSRKYKKSINCKRPKGFSQKQYCKYSRNNKKKSKKSKKNQKI